MTDSDTSEAQKQPSRHGWRRVLKVFGFLGTAVVVLFALIGGDDPSDAVRNAKRDDKPREN